MSVVSIEASIKTEAARNAKLTTDIDNFRNRYVDFDPVSNIEVIFPSFDILTFDKNLFILLNQSEEVKFKTRWYMRPDYVSFDYYKTVIYWPLIMYLNNVYTMEEFVDFETILVPPYTSIFQLFNDRNVDKNILPLQEKNVNDPTVNQFYKKYPLDLLELQKLAASESILGFENKDVLGIYNAEKTEVITLTSEHIANKYVDLLREPASTSSVTLSLNNLNIAQRYNYDYTLKYNGSNSLRRISWKTSDVLESSGLGNIYSSMSTYLRVGTIMKIKYTVAITYRLADGIPSV